MLVLRLDFDAVWDTYLGQSMACIHEERVDGYDRGETP